MPSSSFGQINGSTKFAVPTCTADAPAMMNSSASRASAMPPMPMIGIFTACRHSYTMRTAIGRIAGPLRPPTMFESLRPPRFDIDGHREKRVHQRDRIGAGLFGGARERRDVGDVRRELRDHRQRASTLRTALTTSNVPGRLQPNVMPPSLMFGHEMFSSRAATPSASDRIRASSTYSSSVVPQTLTMHGGAARAQLGQFLVDEPMDADPLQADRVQHAGRRLDDARRRMALALLEEQAFDGDAAERRRKPTGVLRSVSLFSFVLRFAASAAFIWVKRDSGKYFAK